MKEIFVVLIEDRHSDATVKLFTDCKTAVDYAKSVAAEYCHPDDKIEEHDIADWIYYATYSCEGDSVRVERKVVE